jgi:hypothetical protein
MSVIAHYDVEFMLAGVKIIEQALSVEGSAGTGDGNKYSQAL